jgi:peptidoglycan-associated lipoprotein
MAAGESEAGISGEDAVASSEMAAGESEAGISGEDAVESEAGISGEDAVASSEMAAGESEAGISGEDAVASSEMAAGESEAGVAGEDALALSTQEADAEEVVQVTEEAIAMVEQQQPTALAKPLVEAPLESTSESIPELRIIYFEFDKSRIQSQFIEDIKANFEWIQENPHIKIQLEGHADNRGTNEYNLALGERRGNSVLDYLIALGSDLEQFSIISFGEERMERPDCIQENCHGKNRRVVFTRF